MLPRTPEPELMDDEAQAIAYAQADFAEPHEKFVDLFCQSHPYAAPRQVVDLGCGPGDITRRFARRFPEAQLLGVDGSQAMLDAGRPIIDGLAYKDRMRFVQGYLPGATLDPPKFDTVISNSLLHHLADPAALWTSINAYAAPGATVFVMDLMRPESKDVAEAMVKLHCADEPEVLQKDFFYSLLAAYRVDEVRAQLDAAGLGNLTVDAVTDRHFTVWGNTRKDNA